MKLPHITRKLFFLLLTVLLCSCKSEPKPNVDVLLNVYNQSYQSIEPKFDAFINKLEKMDAFIEFEMGTFDMDSINPLEARELLLKLKAEDIPVEKNYSTNELIVIYDDFLSVVKGDQNSIDKELFNMGFLPAKDFSFLTTNSSEFGNLLYRKVYEKWSFTDNDSITLKQKNDVIGKMNKKVAKLDKVKYCLFVDDVIIVNSEQKNDSEFYSGTILMQAKLIDIETQEVLARKVFNIENNNTITVDSDATERFVDINIQMDLLYNKVLAMNTFFGFD